MIEVILVAVLFIGSVILYIIARYGGMFHHPPIGPAEDKTSPAKLFDSKTNDITFFDGESEEYAEARSRTRSLLGA